MKLEKQRRHNESKHDSAHQIASGAGQAKKRHKKKTCTAHASNWRINFSCMSERVPIASLIHFCRNDTQEKKKHPRKGIKCTIVRYFFQDCSNLCQAPDHFSDYNREDANACFAWLSFKTKCMEDFKESLCMKSL